MLDAGERGVADFGKVLEKTALELRRRGGVADADPFPHGLAARLNPSDSDRVREIVWELARQGVLTFGPNASSPGWPAPIAAVSVPAPSNAPRAGCATMRGS